MLTACYLKLFQLSGLLYRANILWMKSWAVVPRPISSLFHTIMSPVLAVQAPSMPSAYGATLELQRIEEEDRIEQALLLANIRRNQHPLNNAQVQVKTYEYSFFRMLITITGLILYQAH